MSHEGEHFLERTRNTNPEAVVLEAISVGETAVKLADPRNDRIYFQVDVLPMVDDVCVGIRLYPASVDDIWRGDWIGQFHFGNDVFFKSFWRMTPDNIYTGEISALVMPGQPTVDLYVTEY